MVQLKMPHVIINIKLKTYNGFEFVCDDFNNDCINKGIQRHRTAQGNCQQNGIIERVDRTIIERIIHAPFTKFRFT